MTDQPEAQPSTAAQFRNLNGTGTVLPLSHQHLYGCSGGPDCYLPKHDCSAAHAAGYREGAAEGAARLREALRRWLTVYSQHENGRDGHTDGFCRPCAGVYTESSALLAASPEAREPGISVEPER